MGKQLHKIHPIMTDTTLKYSLHQHSWQTPRIKTHHSSIMKVTTNMHRFWCTYTNPWLAQHRHAENQDMKQLQQEESGQEKQFWFPGFFFSLAQWWWPVLLPGMWSMHHTVHQGFNYAGQGFSKCFCLCILAMRMQCTKDGIILKRMLRGKGLMLEIF